AEVAWIEAARGIENMVSTEVTSIRNGPPVFGVYDFGQFSGSDDLDDFSLVKGPVDFFSGTTSVASSPFDDGFAASVTTDYVMSGKYPISSAWTGDGGKTWNVFDQMPKGATSAAEFGYGTIAMSTADNMVWAPGFFGPSQTQDGQPYYTLDRGATWQPVVLPGVSSYPLDSVGGYMFGRNRHLVVADEARPNTFYLYLLDVGVFATTDGGVTWEQRFSGNPSVGESFYHSRLGALPGSEGELFFTDGGAGPHAFAGPTPHGGWPMLHSTDGGATWREVPGVDKVLTFGFGAAAPGSAVGTIFIVGDVDGEYGIWRSDDTAASWTKIGTYPLTIDTPGAISGDRNEYGVVYVGYAGSSYAYGRPSS
ncbi:MAG: hypothetical protein R2705_05655, partial [Ilumatobacteraceae bacterium]